MIFRLRRHALRMSPLMWLATAGLLALLLMGRQW